MAAIALLNPHAAGGRAGALAGPLRTLLPADVPLHLSGGVAEALALLRAQPPGTRVLLVGGDGSLHPLLPALVDRGLELALLPFGSGNDTARALGHRAEPLRAAAVAHALQGPAAPMDLGEVATARETRLFASSLAAGFDAAIAIRALRMPRALTGTARYLAATFAELAALQVQPITVTVDGRPVHDGPALFASVLNTPSYGAGMPVAPAARVDDGRLDLVVAGRFGRLGALAMLPRLLTGRHVGHDRVQLAAGAGIVLQARSPLPLAADGEPLAAAAQVRLRVLPGALRAVRAAIAAG